MSPLTESFSMDASAAVGQHMFEIAYRQSQDMYHTLKGVLLSYIVPALLDEKHGSSKYLIDGAAGLMGIEIAGQTLPIVCIKGLGHAVVLRDGTIHNILVSQPNKEVVSISVWSEKDDAGQTHILDHGLHNHTFGNYLLYEKIANNPRAVHHVQQYGLTTHQKFDISHINFWEFHHLDQVTELENIEPYVASMLYFQQKLRETFPPVAERHFN